MGAKDNVICTRLDDDDLAKLDAIAEYLNRTKPKSRDWSRSDVLRHLTDRYYEATKETS